MRHLRDALARLAGDLDAAGCGWALVGGLAVAVRSEPRTTRDVDVAVAVRDDEGAERVVRTLHQRGYSSWEALEQTTAGRLATMRMLAEVEGRETIIDLMFASSGIEGELVASAQRLEIVPGLVVPVARIGHLIALKVLAGRSHDLGDLGQLLRRASEREIEIARGAVDLIAERGFHRDKDVRADLERLLDAGPEKL